MRRKKIHVFAFFLVIIVFGFFSSCARAADLNITITVPGSSTPEVGGNGNGGVIAPTATVSLSGLAYPGSNLTFLRNGVVIGTGSAASDGTFLREFLTTPGEATFSVWARDRFNLISPTISVSFNLEAGSVANIESLALPPTIGHESVGADGSLTIYGSAFPRSIVRIFNNNAPFSAPFEAVAGADGVWRYKALRGAFNPRAFSYKANYQSERLGILSPFSSDLELTLETCANSDFNGDGSINLTDLSILLFYWGRPIPNSGLTNGCVDRNQDRIVDLQDFSILMYEWTLKYEIQ